MIDREQVKRMARACGMDHYEAVTSANVVEPISWVARVEALQRFAALVEKEVERRRHGRLTLCDPLIAAELDADMRNLTPKKARAFLISAGIMNKHGKLAEQYGGEPEGAE